MSRSATTWKPGTSGNPSGRPKKRQELQEFTASVSMDVARAMAEIALNPEEKAGDRIAAGKLVLAYGVGAPDAEISDAIAKAANEIAKTPTATLLALARERTANQ